MNYTLKKIVEAKAKDQGNEKFNSLFSVSDSGHMFFYYDEADVIRIGTDASICKYNLCGRNGFLTGEYNLLFSPLIRNNYLYQFRYDKNCYIVKTDINLNEIWRHYIYEETLNIRIVMSDEGNIYYTYSRMDNSTQLVKLSKDGDIEWRYTPDNGTLEGEITDLPDDKILVSIVTDGLDILMVNYKDDTVSRVTGRQITSYQVINKFGTVEKIIETHPIDGYCFGYLNTDTQVLKDSDNNVCIFSHCKYWEERKYYMFMAIVLDCHGNVLYRKNSKLDAMLIRSFYKKRYLTTHKIPDDLYIVDLLKESESLLLETNHTFHLAYIENYNDFFLVATIENSTTKVQCLNYNYDLLWEKKIKGTIVCAKIKDEFLYVVTTIIACIFRINISE